MIFDLDEPKQLALLVVFLLLIADLLFQLLDLLLGPGDLVSDRLGPEVVAAHGAEVGLQVGPRQGGTTALAADKLGRCMGVVDILLQHEQGVAGIAQACVQILQLGGRRGCRPKPNSQLVVVAPILPLDHVVGVGLRGADVRQPADVLVQPGAALMPVRMGSMLIPVCLNLLLIHVFGVDPIFDIVAHDYSSYICILQMVGCLHHMQGGGAQF